MKQTTNLFRVCGVIFTALCFSFFLLNSCKKDNDDSSKPNPNPSPNPEPEEQLDQYEPNNSINEAGSVAFGAKIIASLHNKDDVDFYKFSGTASGKLDLLKFELSNASPNANFTITIYGKNKEEIAQVPYAGSGIDLSYQMVTKDAEFYVKVSGKDATAYPASYILTVAFANFADKYEPNDDITTAALFTLDKEETLNLLTGDVDFFKIQNLSKENVWDVYEVKLVNKTTDMSPAINFYDASKTEIEDLGFIADKGKDITKQFFMKSGAGNVQYLKVHTISPFTSMPANYTLEVVNKNLNEASEPNDTYSTAQAITEAGTYHGTIIKKISENPADCDIDFVRVTVPIGKEFRYRISGSNIKYDTFYPTSLTTTEPYPQGSNNDPYAAWWIYYGADYTRHFYFAFKATVDLAQWSIEVQLND